ncbi:esterase family protein [Janthinobacterium agaricidamnosum NBRC 102515 = DSM 9628]|uniref:Esterase family protein n=1 Tax=Janthinobacterium agaricidamnosum NBRC 102515 = DSM 9628 TaxID=1349767 RepID=W0VCM5_9BURK|nr:esterase family protein [Janthinobacterium agaricidamnosum NBRC 102515 = DSM 9628]
MLTNLVKSIYSLSACAAAVLLVPPIASAQTPSTFQIVMPSSATAPVSGRLLLFMKCGTGDKSVEVNLFAPESTWIAAQEIQGVAPGATVQFHADSGAYPKPFNEAPACAREIQAVLDVDHTYNRNGRDASDWESDVITVAQDQAVPAIKLDHRAASTVSRTPVMGIPPIVKEGAAQAFDLKSTLLSHFWGKDVALKSWIVLPPDYEKNSHARYPTVYWTHGFGVPKDFSAQTATQIRARMDSGQLPPMIWVMLEQRTPEGTHEFADSLNNGPWGTALTTELIPALERKYRMDGKPAGRLLTGHSSGGWATLQLQLNFPQVFGGTWPSSPDSIDFHQFIQSDIYVANANVYHKPDGSPWPLARFNGKVIVTLEQAAKIEAVLGTYGGQLASFDWVFSPRGADGRPRPLFDRASGAVDAQVARYWRDHYDLAQLLEQRWPKQHALLKGRLHMIVGTEDTFYLDGAVRSFEQRWKVLDSDAKVTYLAGRNHLDLYTVGQDDLGLFDEIGKQMYAVARPGVTWKAKAAVH